jgi:hypothetical protein
VFVWSGAAENEFYLSKMSLYAFSIRTRYWQTLLFTVVDWKRRESEAGTCIRGLFCQVVVVWLYL